MRLCGCWGQESREIRRGRRAVGAGGRRAGDWTDIILGSGTVSQRITSRPLDGHGWD